jgi:hypothetical protein
MLSREDGEASQNASLSNPEILRFAQDDGGVPARFSILSIHLVPLLLVESGGLSQERSIDD